MKGLVVEKEARYYIVLTPTGAYKKIKGFTKMDIGQEVPIGNTSSMGRIASLAASILLIIMVAEAIFRIPGQNAVYAYVTLDINPSVEFAVDAEYHVLKAYPNNPEAEEILSDIEYSKRGIDTVLADFTQAAIEHRYIAQGKDNYVVVSFYPTHSDEPVEAMLNEITEKQREVIERSGEEVEMDAVVIDTKTREEAKELGISPGKLKGNKNGLSENNTTTSQEDNKDIKDIKTEEKENKQEDKKKEKELKQSEKELKQKEKENIKDSSNKEIKNGNSNAQNKEDKIKIKSNSNKVNSQSNNSPNNKGQSNSVKKSEKEKKDNSK